MTVRATAVTHPAQSVTENGVTVSRAHALPPGEQKRLSRVTCQRRDVTDMRDVTVLAGAVTVTPLHRDKARERRVAPISSVGCNGTCNGTCDACDGSTVPTQRSLLTTSPILDRLTISTRRASGARHTEQDTAWPNPGSTIGAVAKSVVMAPRGIASALSSWRATATFANATGASEAASSRQQPKSITSSARPSGNAGTAHLTAAISLQICRRSTPNATLEKRSWSAATHLQLASATTAFLLTKRDLRTPPGGGAARRANALRTEHTAIFSRGQVRKTIFHRRSAWTRSERWSAHLSATSTPGRAFPRKRVAFHDRGHLHARSFFTPAGIPAAAYFRKKMGA